MASGRGRDTSLSGKIFRSVTAFTIVVILALAVVMSAIYYNSYERDAEKELISQAQDAASYLNETPGLDNAEILEAQFAGEIRYTLIAADGTVIFDSYEAEGQLENHAERPEIREAASSGQASSLRYSETLQSDTVYAAVKLDDGSIVRLAETRHSLLAFFGNLVGPIAIALVVAVILVFILSKLLANRIMKPLDALDLAQPLENDVYEEMGPLLQRIDAQQSLLMQQNEKLAAAESMRRDFSSNVSHEMKTPLQVISGYAELMKNDMVAPEDRQKSAQLIYDEAQAMRKLIDDILTLSRLDEYAISDADERVDVHEIAKQAAARLSSFAEAYEVVIEVEGSPAYMLGSRALLEQMLSNLIENGVRYNKALGKVVVSVVQAHDEVAVTVADTGTGVPDEMQEKIFERFFRIDKSRSKETGGTGLGLAIVKHAVIFHKGTIAVRSELGEGTVFTLRFPAA